MKYWLIGAMLVMFVAPALAASIEGTVSLSHRHHFQGLQQNEHPTSIHGAAQIGLGAWSGGIWIGRYEFPQSLVTSTEIDYFLGYGKQLGFRHRIDTALWQYTYSEDGLSSYEWSQWITHYTWDGRVTLTLGVADNLLQSDRPSVLAEALIRHPVTSELSVSIAAGHHRFSKHIIESFSYGTIKAVYTHDRWRLSADVTATSDDEGITGRWTHHGVSATVSYRF